MLALGQGPLLLRGAQLRAAARPADAEAAAASGRRSTGRSRSISSRRELKRIREQHGAAVDRRARDAAPDARRAVSAAEARARARLGQRGFPPAPVAISAPTASAPGAPWLGMKIAESEQARPRAGGRQHAAQGPSADRAPPAPGDEARSAASIINPFDDDLLMRGRAQGDRRARGDGARCWRRWSKGRRRGEERRRSRQRARRGRARRAGRPRAAHRREPRLRARTRRSSSAISRSTIRRPRRCTRWRRRSPS